MATAGWLQPGVTWIFSREGLLPQLAADARDATIWVQKKPIEASARIGGQSWLFTTF